MDQKEWKDKLLYQPKNGLLRASEEDAQAAWAFCEPYKAFLNDAKTEREAVCAAIKLAKAAGFAAYEKGKTYVPGDRYYVNNRGNFNILH